MAELKRRADVLPPALTPARRGRLPTFKPVRPNLSIEIAYRKRVQALVDDMHRSVLHWVKVAFRSNEPEIAQDELPATTMKRAVGRMARRWQSRFDEAAPELADYFGKSVSRRSDASLRRILHDGGFTVEFKMTRAQRDIVRATVDANVGLIKTIPQKYLNDVRGSVLRSVQSGRKLDDLAKEIEHTYGVTTRRAALIARDQNNKATSALSKARRIELGLFEAVWLHSGGGKHPRPKHVAASGKKYDVRKGLPIGDKGQYVSPGEEIGCRCVSKAVVPGF